MFLDMNFLEELQFWVKEWADKKNIEHYVETSAATNVGVVEPFHTVAEMSLQ